MALFMDGTVSEVDDLRQFDGSVLDVASAEQIDLTESMRVARQEVGAQLLAFLVREYGSFLGQESTLERVVVSEALRRWHTLHTLSLVYREAHSRLLNDRYRQRAADWTARADEAAESLMLSGVGLVLKAVRQAPVPDMVAATPGSTTFYAASSWVDEQGREGQASDINSVVGGSIQVQHGAAPGGVMGWHVYAGLLPDRLTRQNAATLPLNTAWTSNGSTLSFGAVPSSGQRAELLMRRRRLLQRG